jgi:hypothetical protein
MTETTSWCPQCGAEYREGVTACPDCGVALTTTPPTETVSEVVVYELDEWTADQRGALEMRLQAEGIEHQWEAATGADLEPGYEPGDPWTVATDLVVGERDEETVDELLDEVESPNALEEATDDDGGDDEATYSVMSHLYVAADRLKDDPGDLALAGEFFDAADAARTIEPPFGIEPEVWRRVQELAGEVSLSIEQEEHDEVVATNAKRLRDVLFSYV